MEIHTKLRAKPPQRANPGRKNLINVRVVFEDFAEPVLYNHGNL